jgi:hypothetical protein
MKLRTVILIVVVVCLAIAAGFYAYAYYRTHQADPHPILPVAHKASPATIEDGTYTVRIHSILTAGEVTTITFDHVTYFEDDAASSTAAHDIECPDDRPLEACAPTLIKGYFVRESGAPAFTAPIVANSAIVLKQPGQASIDALRSLDRQFDPVFDVVIQGGAIVSLTEKSPI